MVLGGTRARVKARLKANSVYVEPVFLSKNNPPQLARVVLKETP
jgi:hypothetical protein